MNNIIQDFLHLPFDGHDIHCPYFNNRRSGSRGSLRVLVGKGTAQEIVEEAQLLALRDKVDLKKFSDEELTKYLVDKNLGIDCSALAYYILDELTDKPLKKTLHFPHAKNPIRKLLTNMRPVENCNVATLAHEKNSSVVKLSDVQPGDMIILKNAGPRNDYNHVMIITNVDNADITYIHAFQYPNDGLYDHGVRHEHVTFDTAKTLAEQNWDEDKMKQYITTARQVEIRRLKHL